MKFEPFTRLLIRSAILPLLFFAWALPVSAQEATTSKDSAFTKISLVAVGDPPDPSFEIVGGRRKLGDMADAEYPPTLLHVPKAEEKGKTDMITLGLNLPGQQLKLKGTRQLSLMEAIVGGGETTYKEWTTVPLPETSEDLSVFLYRSSPRASWRKSPKALVLRNGPVGFPPRHVRLINLSKQTLSFQLEASQAFPLRPMEVKVIPAGQAEYYSYSAAYKDGGQLKIVAQQQACSMHADSRVNLVAYDSDSATKTDRPAVTLQCFYELPQPPKPPAPGTGKPVPTTP